MASMTMEPSRRAQPNKGIAALLACVGPWGTGQLYLGQTRRALLWLLVPTGLYVLCLVALKTLGAAVGYGSLLVGMLVGAVVVWAGSLVDVFLVPAARLRPARGTHVLGFLCGGALLLTIFVPLLLRATVVEAFKIPSGAMQPTLLVGDHLMAGKLGPKTPKRGEMIIFRFPEHPEQDFVKRVIAVPGDTLEVRQGHPWLNGWEVPHCLVGPAKLARTWMPEGESGESSGDLFVEFLDGEAYLVFYDAEALRSGVEGPYAVAPGEVWVLGDNRNNSHDSRFWFGGKGGGVPFDHVKARPLFWWLRPPSESGEAWFGASVAEPRLPASMRGLTGELGRCLASRPSREKTVPPHGP